MQQTKLQPPGWFFSLRRKTVSYSNNKDAGRGPTHECNNNKFSLAGSTKKVAVIFTWNSCIPERFADVGGGKRAEEDGRFALSSPLHKWKRGAAPRCVQGGHLFTVSVMLWRLKLPLGSIKSPGWRAAGTPVNSATLMVSLERALWNEIWKQQWFSVRHCPALNSQPQIHSKRWMWSLRMRRRAQQIKTVL